MQHYCFSLNTYKSWDWNIYRATWYTDLYCLNWYIYSTNQTNCCWLQISKNCKKESPIKEKIINQSVAVKTLIFVTVWVELSHPGTTNWWVTVSKPFCVTHQGNSHGQEILILSMFQEEIDSYRERQRERERARERVNSLK